MNPDLTDQVKASASSPGAAQLTMSLKNLGGSTQDVYLLRVASMTATANNPEAQFDFTWNTAVASFFLARPRFGLGLTNNTNTLLHNAFTQNTPLGPDPCQPATHWNWGLFGGQGSIGQFYHHTVHAGSTMTVSMIYRPQ